MRQVVTGNDRWKDSIRLSKLERWIVIRSLNKRFMKEGDSRKYEGNTIGNRIYFPSAGSVVTPPSSFPFLLLPLILLNGSYTYFPILFLKFRKITSSFFKKEYSTFVYVFTYRKDNWFRKFNLSWIYIYWLLQEYRNFIYKKIKATTFEQKCDQWCDNRKKYYKYTSFYKKKKKIISSVIINWKLPRFTNSIPITRSLARIKLRLCARSN